MKNSSASTVTRLQTDDVAVSIETIHYCVKSRGVMDANSRTQTTALGGTFKAKHKTRAEFLA
jgi:GTP cyclohydrolase I